MPETSPDLFGIACTQCGSRDLNHVGNGVGCNACGTIQIRRRDVGDATALAVQWHDQAATIERLTEQKNALHREQNHATDILAEALGYLHDPIYGWVTGDHSITTIAMEAAAKIRELSADTQ